MSYGGSDPYFESDSGNDEAIEAGIPHCQIEKGPLECRHCDFVDDDLSFTRFQLRNDLPVRRTLEEEGLCLFRPLFLLPYHGATQLANPCEGVRQE